MVPRTSADSLTPRPVERPGRLALARLHALDQAVFDAIADTPTAIIDVPLRMLTRSANHSALWLSLAAMLARWSPRRGRRAALEGVVAIGATSATINGAIKPLARRGRPGSDGAPRFSARAVPMPGSPSMPSGHAGSAFAFASSVSRHLPVLALPLRLLAGGVAYSRIHAGVHYPGDVLIGSIVGTGMASMVAAASDRLARARA